MTFKDNLSQAIACEHGILPGTGDWQTSGEPMDQAGLEAIHRSLIAALLYGFAASPGAEEFSSIRQGTGVRI